MASEIEALFAQLQETIRQPYPDSVGTISGWMHSATLETHLLPTQRRKTVLLMEKTGDYEYDEEMTLDVELKLKLEIDQCYAQLCERMSAAYGAAINLELDDPALQARIEPEDYDEEEASYLTGAYYDNADDGEESFWLLGADYVCLQTIRRWGDGNFQFYVIATITPRESV